MNTQQLRDKISWELYDANYDKLDSSERSRVDAVMAPIKDHVDYVIGEDETELNHTVGNHSDDRGGDSDFPCHCQREKVIAVNVEKAMQRNRGAGY